MRIALALVFLFTGCATYTYESPLAAIGMEPLPKACPSSGGNVPVDLVVRNNGQEALRLYVRPEPSRPPYRLSWLSYDIQNDQGIFEHGPGGHGPLPQKELVVAPGDAVRVTAYVYDLELKDYSSRFVVQITDLAGREYSSPVFVLCRT